MAMLNYRTAAELNERFERSWQSDLDPLGGDGRFAVESYLDFHGNKFTRRFDANSYIVLTEAMNSHDVGRGRGGVAAALDGIRAKSLVLGIDSDRYFSLEGQVEVAGGPPATACTAGIRCSCTRSTGTTRSSSSTPSSATRCARCSMPDAAGARGSSAEHAPRGPTPLQFE